MHGKTSPLRHDSKGVYAGLPQDLPVTRYHSLAGTHASLPDCLEVSSWIASGPDGGKGIIMGVRHKSLLVEGVQFHPESILTAEGRLMIKNFLRMHGGTWEENAVHHGQPEKSTKFKRDGRTEPINGVHNGISHSQVKTESILDNIYRHRRQAVDAQKQIPSQRLIDLEELYNLGLAPPQISFPDRLRLSPYPLSLMAEIKRASPSKGDIAMTISAPAQARKYAAAGASVISVLTEPEWFKGSLEDLRAVRQSLKGMHQRPAILRKDFVFDEYQILEARLAGADTVLLIVKMLDIFTLQKLYAYSQELGMEPLVEVNTTEEMEVAIKLGAQVIGVNNRNLTDFEVDLGTTSRLMDQVPSTTIVCALSGISGPNDVKAYKGHGVGAILVGEALMRASNVNMFVSELLSSPDETSHFPSNCDLLVKICGMRSPEAAEAAIEAGADMIGIILVNGRKRFVKFDVASAISKVVHQTERPAKSKSLGATNTHASISLDYFEHNTTFIRNSHRALLVGVFQNQTLQHILEQQRLLDLDIIQLHGSEPIEWSSLIPVPVIRRFGAGDPGIGTREYHCLPLLDSAAGGSGETIDMAPVLDLLKRDPSLRVILAGGLTVGNLKATLSQLQHYRDNIVAVDVSSGVEQEGSQSLEKIWDFTKVAKTAL